MAAQAFLQLDRDSLGLGERGNLGVGGHAVVVDDALPVEAKAKVVGVARRIDMAHQVAGHVLVIRLDGVHVRRLLQGQEATRLDLAAKDVGKRKVGSAHPSADKARLMDVPARNLRTGLPVNIKLHSSEIREAMLPEIAKIINAIRTTLENTPPELSADIYDRGIMMTGGGSLLPGFDKLITQKTGLRATVASHPLDCVVTGIGIMMQNSSGSWTDRLPFRFS